jgi:hypothetical protein
MQVRARPIVLFCLIILAACASEDVAAEVAIHNLGTDPIDATVSDGKAPLEFAGVAAGTTSTFQTVSFASLSGIMVSVGSVTSTTTLTAAARNVVDVAADGKVSGVRVQVIAGGSQAAW